MRAWLRFVLCPRVDQRLPPPDRSASYRLVRRATPRLRPPWELPTKCFTPVVGNWRSIRMRHAKRSRTRWNNPSSDGKASRVVWPGAHQSGSPPDFAALARAATTSRFDFRRRSKNSCGYANGHARTLTACSGRQDPFSCPSQGPRRLQRHLCERHQYRHERQSPCVSARIYEAARVRHARFFVSDFEDEHGRARIGGGYVGTIYGCQGMTVDQVIVLKGPQLSFRELCRRDSRAARLQSG